MRQPATVRILNCSEKTLFNLPDTAMKCKIQERDSDDVSKVVYVRNPGYTVDSETDTKYLAFCENEYEVVEWTN